MPLPPGAGSQEVAAAMPQAPAVEQKPAEVPVAQAPVQAAPVIAPPKHEAPPEPPAPAVEKPKFKTVRATGLGYYKCQRKKEGDVFQIPAEQPLGKWMVEV